MTDNKFEKTEGFKRLSTIDNLYSAYWNFLKNEIADSCSQFSTWIFAADKQPIDEKIKSVESVLSSAIIDPNLSYEAKQKILSAVVNFLNISYLKITFCDFRFMDKRKARQLVSPYGVPIRKRSLHRELDNCPIPSGKFIN